MKIYLDTFKKPITKEDVLKVVQVVVSKGVLTPISVQLSTKISMSKVRVIYRLLEDADIITVPSNGKQSVILKDIKQANNAALRQLRKGNA